MSKTIDARRYGLTCPNCKHALEEIRFSDEEDDKATLFGFSGVCADCGMPNIIDADDKGRPFMRAMTPEEFDEKVPDGVKALFLQKMVGKAMEKMVDLLFDDASECDCPRCTAERKENEG